MPITKAISSKTNTKQVTNQDAGGTGSGSNSIVTATYGPVTSAAGQTVINLSFAVTTSNTANFLLIINGKVLSLGAGNDYTFTSVQANGTSSQVTLNQAISAGLNIQAIYLGVVSPTFSLSTLTAQVNALTASSKNILINGNMDLWQRGTTSTVANASTAYVADRWYAKNSLGTSGVITNSQVAGVSVGAQFGNSVKITTAPTAGQTNGTELYQVIDNENTLLLLNKSLSFSAQIKALGNVTSVGLQFFYATTEVKPTTLTLGSEQTVTVNSSTFTLGSLLAQSVGTTPTSTGVVAVRIRILGVSTGNTYDLNNGFVVEQGIVNVGTTAATFERAGRNFADEVLMCQRYYEKSFDLNQAPTNVQTGAFLSIGSATSGGIIMTVPFKAVKRTAASITFINPTLGGSSWETSTDSASITAALSANSLYSMTIGTSGTPAAGTAYKIQWTADADI